MTVPNNIIVKIQFTNGDTEAIKLAVEGTKFKEYYIEDDCLMLLSDEDFSTLPKRYIPLANIKQIDVGEAFDYKSKKKKGE